MVYVKMVNENKIGTDLYLNCSFSFKLRLRVVPHFSSGTVERSRKGDTPYVSRCNYPLFTIYKTKDPQNPVGK